MKVIAIALAVVSLAFSQWRSYPTPGVPKTPRGVVNLGAPTPRTTNGKPDLSGVWEAENVRPGFADILAEQYLDLGFGMNEGPPCQPWARDILKARQESNGQNGPSTNCRPLSIFQYNTFAFPRKMIQTPELVVILNDLDGIYRQIFTDGRPLPEDPNPSWSGYSSGKWEKDTLVAQTAGFRGGQWLDAKGSHLTEAAKVTERFRRLNYGNLEIEISVDDPKAYIKPWRVKLNQYIVLNEELLEYVCLENENSIQHMEKK